MPAGALPPGDLTPRAALAGQPRRLALQKCGTAKGRYSTREADKGGGQGHIAKDKLSGRMLWDSLPPGMPVGPTSSPSYSSGP